MWPLLSYSRVVFVLDAIMVGEFDGLVIETMHSLVDVLGVLLVAKVQVQLVLSSTIQPAPHSNRAGTQTMSSFHRKHYLCTIGSIHW